MDDKEQYKLIFTESAYSADAQRSNLQHKKKFTKKVAEAQKSIEALDSHDDFHELLIDGAHYKRTRAESGKYGISLDRDVHDGDEVILPHQKTAAESFLRDLRGFGLLADVVGSGKTFEAGIILSELAVRGKMKSLIVVTPDQVFNSWVNVLEMQFGMGEGVLYKVAKNGDYAPSLRDVLDEVGTKKENGFIRPKRPIIVDVDIFAQWDYANDLLIDVVVVDEAHHLSEDVGKYAGAMRMLSEMMQTKKRAGATYCLLLTATPHTGNLENMFRLWYFVRCKGGNPSDFDEKDDSARTAQYREEKKYYKNTVCYGASNITEFVRRVKYTVVMNQGYKERGGNAERRFVDKLYDYLDAVKRRYDFDRKSEYDRAQYIEDFLSGEGIKNDAVRSEYEYLGALVRKRVANAYHNGVLRSIMIRQPNNDLAKIIIKQRGGNSGAKKTVYNYFYFPMSEVRTTAEVQGLNDRKITLDFSTAQSGGEPIVFDGCSSDGKALSEYIECARGNRSVEQAYAAVINGVIVDWAENDPQNDVIHTKQGYVSYYGDRLRGMPKSTGESRTVTRFIPVEQSSDALGYKFDMLKRILKEHGDKRAIVFFDYNLPKEQSVYDEVCTALESDDELRVRIIIGDAKQSVGKIEREFNSDKRSDAILVVKDGKFTEGANLQEACVIVNYQVTYDPLAMDQRIGRIFRLGQKNKVSIYSLADMNKLEGFALAYFANIGLMSGNSGDATILAGSNSDQMVALRCNACKRVTLMSKEQYDVKRRTSPEDLVCSAEEQCKGRDGRGTEMTEISVYDFRCDGCGTVLTRSAADGYMCVANVERGERGRMCNSGDRGDKSVYCPKICAISHCRRFAKGGKLFGKCPLLERYGKRPNMPDSEIMLICAMCKNPDCFEKCKIIGEGKKQIAGCSTCEYSGCSPNPHIIDFNERWEAKCPMPDCRRGKLRPVVARTFATFVSELWKFEHDGGAGFCKNLGEQAKLVADIREILAHDGRADGEEGR